MQRRRRCRTRNMQGRLGREGMGRGCFVAVCQKVFFQTGPGIALSPPSGIPFAARWGGGRHCLYVDGTRVQPARTARVRLHCIVGGGDQGGGLHEEWDSAPRDRFCAGNGCETSGTSTTKTFWARRNREDVYGKLFGPAEPGRGENGSGRGQDAGHTIGFEATDADRTRAWPFLPGRYSTTSG
eukprot:gene17193-biopygen791